MIHKLQPHVWSQSAPFDLSLCVQKFTEIDSGPLRRTDVESSELRETESFFAVKSKQANKGTPEKSTSDSKDLES